jgi:hypothetical protein
MARKRLAWERLAWQRLAWQRLALSLTPSSKELIEALA